MNDQTEKLSPRLEYSFILAVGSLILFTGIFPSFLAGVGNALPQWVLLLLLTLPIQFGNIASCVIPARHFCPEEPLDSVLDLKLPGIQDFRRIIPGTLGVYVTLALLTGATVFTLQKVGIRPQEQMAVEILRGGSPLLTGILIPVTVILAPLGEELCFRHAIYKKLEFHFGPTRATWITAMIFAAAHLNLQVFPALFLLSIWLTALYRRTGSLLAAVIAHAQFNTMTIVLILLTGAQK